MLLCVVQHVDGLGAGGGAVNPTVGFKYALRSGADFMCVGMFDFQITDDVKIVKGIFARGIKRDRPWRA